MKRNVKRFWGIGAFLVMFAAASAVVMLLWNWLIPSIIGWAAINYWKAAGLLLLCKILFGGFGRGHFLPHRHAHPHFSPVQRRQIHEKVKNMSPEERREYIRKNMFGGFHEHCPEKDNEKQ